MDPNETDASPRTTGQQPPSKRGARIDWSAIDAYCGRTPPDHEDEWTIVLISQFAHGERAVEDMESPTGEPVTRGEPHWYVTVPCDRFPTTKRVTADFEHYVFPTGSALAAWFEENGEPDQ